MLKRILIVVSLIIGGAVIATAQNGLKPYFSKDGKAGFNYPAGWKLGKQKVYFDDDEPKFTVLVELQPASLRGYVQQAEVVMSMAMIDETTCRAMDIGNITKVKDKPVTLMSGGNTFSFLEAQEGAMGHAGSTHYYRTFYDGRCYELAFLKVGINTAKRPDQYERTLDKQYNGILRSFYMAP